MRKPAISQNANDESGMTLVETLIAVLILMFGLLAMAQVLAFSVVASKNYGRDATKSTAFAHDKMDRLTGLDFSDAALTAGGSLPPAASVDGYRDYLDVNGAVVANAAAAFYTRQWQITDNTLLNPTLKTIAVAVTSNKSFRYGAAPSTTIVTQKASPLAALPGGS